MNCPSRSTKIIQMLVERRAARNLLKFDLLALMTDIQLRLETLFASLDFNVPLLLQSFSNLCNAKMLCKLTNLERLSVTACFSWIGTDAMRQFTSLIKLQHLRVATSTSAAPQDGRDFMQFVLHFAWYCNF